MGRSRVSLDSRSPGAHPRSQGLCLVWFRLRHGLQPVAPLSLLFGLSGFWGRGGAARVLGMEAPEGTITARAESHHPPCHLSTRPTSGACHGRPGGNTGPAQVDLHGSVPRLPQQPALVTQAQVAGSLPPGGPPRISTESPVVWDLNKRARQSSSHGFSYGNTPQSTVSGGFGASSFCCPS